MSDTPRTDKELAFHELARSDANALASGMTMYARQLERENARLRVELYQARIRIDNTVELLSSIHSLLYPPPINLADGRTMVFRPDDPNPHTVLQELSDRIRGLPEQIAALAKEGK